jgi:hypothetical protein
MEQQPQSPTTPKRAPAPRGAARCRRRSRANGRCRLPVQDPATGLCSKHAALAARTTPSAADRADLSADLFAGPIPSFKSAEEINATLAHLVVLVAQGRISSRRAAVITYALSLILRGVLVIDKKAANAPIKIEWDDDWRPACAIHAESLRNASAAVANSRSNDAAKPPVSSHQS